MEEVRYIKLENPDGSYSEPIAIGAESTQIHMDNNKTLQETIGTIDVDTDGNINTQLGNIKEDISGINNDLDGKIPKTDITDNLNSNDNQKPLSAKQGKILNRNKISYYTTLEDMIEDSELVEGIVAKTLGYYEVNDGGAGDYLIVNDSSLIGDYGSVLDLRNGLKAKLIIKDNTVTVEQFGLIGDGVTDNSDRMRNILTFKGDDYIKIVFSKNKVYGMQQVIYFYGNTEIDLNQATIKCLYTGGPDDSYVKFANGLRFYANVESVKVPGYGAIKNFHIYNGTLDGGNSGVTFAILHGENFSWKNIKFYNCSVGTHIVDMGGCKDFLFENCLFTGSWIVDANNYREMLQPDYATYGGLPYWGNDASFAFDALPTINLTVRGCTFEKGEGTHYPNAIGTHGANTAFPENFLIENCTFHDCTYSAIRLPHIKGVKIINNIFYNENPNKVGDHYMINFIGVNRAEPSGEDILIKGNTFKSLLGNELGDDNTIFIGIIANSNNTTWFKNIQIIDNIAYGTYQRAPEDMGKESSAVPAVHSGQDFLQLRRAEQLDIINNKVVQMKQLIYIDNPINIKDIRIKDNYMENMRLFVRCGSNNASKVEGSVIEDNVWAVYDSTGTHKNVYNLNHQSFTWSLEELTKTTETSGFQLFSLPASQNEEENEFVIDQNGYLRIPHYIKRFKIKIQFVFHFNNKYGTEEQIVTSDDGNWWMNVFCRQYQNLGIGTTSWSIFPTGSRIFIPKDANSDFIVQWESPVIDYSEYWTTDKHFYIGAYPNVYPSVVFRKFIRSTTGTGNPDSLGTYLTIEAC